MGIAKKPEALKVQLEGCPDRQHFEGTYVQVTRELAKQQRFRKIRSNGEWSRFFLTYEEENRRWAILKDEKPIAWSQDVPADAPVPAPFEVEWHAHDVLLRVSRIELNEVDLAARRVANKFFENPRPYTKWRATACPTVCKTLYMKDWGAKDVASLYAHLCFYHREHDQYRSMNKRYWREEVAEALRFREDSEEFLLDKFASCLRRHGYEDKTVTLEAQHHARKLKAAADYLQRPVSRNLPSQDAFEELRMWDKDIKARRHFSVSLKWFSKFLEVEAMEEILHRADEWEVPPEPEILSQASKSSKSKRPRPLTEVPASQILEPSRKKAKASVKADEEDEEVEFLGASSHSQVERAADPLKTILRRQMHLQAPRAATGPRNIPTPNRSGSGAKSEDKVHHLAKHFQQVEKSVEYAETVAAGVEKRSQFLKVGVAEKDLEFVWLWAYTGVRERGDVLGQMQRHYGLTDLLMKLLSVARCPHRAPTDILPILGALCCTETPSEQMSFKSLQALANKAFQVPAPLYHLEKESKPIYQFSIAGAEIGRNLSCWPSTRKAVESWYEDFVSCLAAADNEQMLLHGVAFATAFFLNYSPQEAGPQLEKIRRPVASCLARDFETLQKIALAACPACATPPAVAKPVEENQTEGGKAPEPAAATAGSSLSAEQRMLLERKRQAALAKKHKAEAPVEAEVPAAQADIPAAEVEVSDAGPCIQEMDEDGFKQPVEGKIARICHHKTGGGFHFRLGDRSGHVDAKFWLPAAEVFREHPALQVGAVVRLTGLKALVLKGPALDFSPPGRKHFLNCQDATNVSIELLQAPENVVQKSALELMEAVNKPEKTCVDIRNAWVTRVEDLEFKETKDGTKPLRVVWLTPERGSATRVRWSLWGETAMEYGFKQLDGQRLSIRGAQTKRFGGQRELVGCFREGGIHLLPESGE